MDESQSREALAQADQHIMQSRQRIAKQHALIKQLERDGHDSSIAKSLLQEFRHSLQLHIIGRATIEADIARTRFNPADTTSTRGRATTDPDHESSDQRAQPPRPNVDQDRR